MRYAVYIDIDGPNRLQALLEALNWAVYDLVKTDPNSPKFDVQAYAVPELEAWNGPSARLTPNREK